jgi:hypothetical protein
VVKVRPQVIDDEEHERVYERVAAVDVAKDSGMVHPPPRTRPGPAPGKARSGRSRPGSTRSARWAMGWALVSTGRRDQVAQYPG